MEENNQEKQLVHLIEEALKEDVGNGDYSTLCCIPEEKIGTAALKIKQDGIIAGIEIAKRILQVAVPSFSMAIYKLDGEKVQPGEIAFELEAPVRTILQCERVILNCMQRMSGIATLTRKYVDKLQGYRTKILDTRKTTPNFRLLEKQAVKIGGASNHRFGLYDMIMLKDNHIDYCGGIEPTINKAYQYVLNNNLSLHIEVEARTLEDVKAIVSAGNGKVFRIMLDNFSVPNIREAINIINGLFEIEASGGINLDNIQYYAETGVDYVSVGALIHQATSLDLSLKAII